MKILFSILLFGCICTGCLKKDEVLDYSGINPVVAIPNSNWPAQAFPAEDSVFDATLSSAKVNLYAKISFQAPLNTDLKITIQNDAGLVTEYNNKFGGGRGWQDYILLPASAYQLPNLQLTIPAGSQQAILPITVYPDKMISGEKYILPFTIIGAESSTIAANYKTMIYTVMVQ